MEILQIVVLSLVVSSTATLFSFLIGFFLSLFIFLKNFILKKWLINFLNALTGVPTVIFGLCVLLLLSRKGPFGSLKLLFTPTAIIIAQFFLLLPLVITLSLDLFNGEGKKILETCKILQIPKNKIAKIFLKELIKPLVCIFLIAFSRAISEVGAVSLVGGNIKGHTRVMTTYIALSTSMGNYDTSIIIALILFVISFLINYLLRRKA
ncbi:MAG: ABC transporter permease [Cetobacterium sp.]|uniref:ABC transporter permease n=1 Tax=Cetobacterium sp. TaxID=2071632 RepID=UPI002FC76582